MAARLLDGAATAAAIRGELKAGVAALLGRGVRPGLGVLLVGDDPASAVYVRTRRAPARSSASVHETQRLPATRDDRRGPGAVAELNARAGRARHPGATAPAAAGRRARACSTACRPAKDVDGFHPENVGLLVQKRPRFVACTPAGIMEMLRRNGIEVAGRRAVVVGRSDIVGKPMALLLMHADATVTVCHSRTRDLAAVCREADILVAAIGRAGLVRGEHVKPGAVWSTSA